MADYDRRCLDCGNCFVLSFPDSLTKQELFEQSYNTPSPCCGNTNYRQNVRVEKGIFVKDGSLRVKNDVFEHIAPEPLRIRDKAELRDKCIEHGVYSRALQDGMLR